ncbi:GLPGLI family protein [uncultured Alistipes sp.]|uniref:GLPGLI family protein n=1 Tax=uncultured Alistipes sp. TaxID=538949 RepID=UPI0025DD6A70|nr:GLPGLI family protein [uncultured Alistipes sp.]
MKFLPIILLVFCFRPSSARHGTSFVEAHYAEQWSIDTLTRQRGYDTVVLRVQGARSCYWSRNQYFRDSLLALPDGRRRFMWLVTQMVARKSRGRLLCNLGEYIYRSGDTTVTRATLNLGTSNDPVEIVGPTEIPHWRLLDSCRTIGAHVCYLAEADFRGRHWIAWYAPDVPLPHGSITEYSLSLFRYMRCYL